MRTRNRRTWIVPVLLMAVAVGGCEDFLDVNDNPNTPEFVAMEQTLPGLLVEFNYVLSDSPLYWSSLWLQEISYNRDQFGYSQVHKYELTSIDTNGFWAGPYDDVMMEAKNIMTETEENEDWEYHGIAKFMLAWTGTILSDMYGPVPFSEALDPLNPDPAYDSQKDVYSGAQALIAEAIEEMQMGGNRHPGANDLMFDGDMARWVQLAHAVQARLNIHLAYAPGESATDRAQAALQEVSQAITSNAGFIYTGVDEGEAQPLYGYEGSDWNTSDVASSTMIDRLKALNDPRIAVMFQPAEYDGEFRGHVPGENRNTTGDPFFDEEDRCEVAPESCDPADENYPDISWNDSIMSKIGDAVTADTLDYLWFSLAELKFIEAEARLITSGAGAADAPYRAGIRAHMEWLAMDDATIDAYLESLPPLSAEADPLKAIIVQKYIADFLQLENYNDWRRTGYPDDLYEVTAPYIPGIPQRLRTPADEIQYNSDNVVNTGIPTGLDGMLVKVWWASGS